MPGFLATCLVDRERRTGGVVLANATTGYSPAAIVTELLDELERCEPTLPEPWRPSAALPAELVGVPGVWHWGNTPFVFAMEGDRAGGPAQRRRGATASGSATAGWSAVTGYHAGEELKVVRRPDGAIGHLDIATFIYTRTPYDPDAPIPGGHPGWSPASLVESRRARPARQELPGRKLCHRRRA